MAKTVKIDITSVLPDGRRFQGFFRSKLSRNAIIDETFVGSYEWQEVVIKNGCADVYLFPNGLMGDDTYYDYQVVARSGYGEKVVQTGVIIVPDHDCNLADIITIPFVPEDQQSSYFNMLKAQAAAQTSVSASTAALALSESAKREADNAKLSADEAARLLDGASDTLAGYTQALESQLDDHKEDLKGHLDVVVGQAEAARDEAVAVHDDIASDAGYIRRYVQDIPVVKSSLEEVAAEDRDGLYWVPGAGISDEEFDSDSESIKIINRLGRQITNLRSLLCTSYDDTSEAYLKAVPSEVAPWAEIKSIGGRTLMWNQLVNINGLRPTDGSISNPALNPDTNEFSGFLNDNNRMQGHVSFTIGSPIYKDHVYAIFAKIKASAKCVYQIRLGGGYPLFDVPMTDDYVSVAVITTDKQSNSLNYALGFYIIAKDASEAGRKIWIKDVSLVDLTVMFGQGNEPKSVNAVKPSFDGFVPFNMGETVSSNVTEIISKSTSKPIPAAIRALPGYGTEGTLIDVEGKRYINNGQETDISDLLPEDWGHIEVEPGGTVEFKSSTGLRIPVPSTITYDISTKEAV